LSPTIFIPVECSGHSRFSSRCVRCAASGAANVSGKNLHRPNRCGLRHRHRVNGAQPNGPRQHLAFRSGLIRLFLIANYPVYLLWRLFEWWFAYEAYAPQIFEKAGAIAAAGGMAGALFAIINSVWRARQSQLVTTYGSARWASSKVIKAAGLFAARGVFLGRLENSYLRHDGPEHVMCFAPTRSGKGVGLVLPTLLSWTSSAVVRRHRGFRGVDRRPVQPSYQGILSGRIHPCHAVPSGMAVQRIRLVVTVCGRFPPKKGDQVGGKDQTKSMLSPVQLSLGVALGPSNRRHCSYSGLHAGAD
jgi:Type IV secretory system Conjugative DNA transfer